MGPYRQAPEEYGGEWYLVNPFTTAEPWLLDERVRKKPEPPAEFLEIFGPRPNIMQFRGTPSSHAAHRLAVQLWDGELQRFQGIGLPEWATSEQVTGAEQVFQAWDMGRPRYYHGRHGWMTRFTESQAPDYQVGTWSALNWTHGVIAHYQIALVERGIEPAKQHPFVPPHIWPTE